MDANHNTRMKFLRMVLSVIFFSIPLFRAYVPQNYKGQYLYFLGFAIIAFVFYQYTLIWVSTISKNEVWRKSQFFNNFLYNIKSEMIDIINEYKDQEQQYLDYDGIRVNVMLILKRKFFVIPEKLKMCYFSGNYTENEKKLTWNKKGNGSGTCGAAYGLKMPVIYDSVNPHYRMPVDRLSKEQLSHDEIKEVNSVLSVPIWSSNNSIIGVLNFDSYHNIEHTYFDREGIIEEAVIKSVILGLVLPGQRIN